MMNAELYHKLLSQLTSKGRIKLDIPILSTILIVPVKSSYEVSWYSNNHEFPYDN